MHLKIPPENWRPFCSGLSVMISLMPFYDVDLRPSSELNDLWNAVSTPDWLLWLYLFRGHYGEDDIFKIAIVSYICHGTKDTFAHIILSTMLGYEEVNLLTKWQ